MSGSTLSTNSDLASRVMEVTGSSRQVAMELLAACANDVQAAVDLFLANDENDVDLETDVVDVESVGDCRDVDGVRAPIAPIREQLIGPEDDNFRPVAHATGPTAKSRSLPRIKVCPLRDFAREGSIMEETLANTDTIHVPVVQERHTRPSSSRHATRTSTSISSSSSSSPVATNRLGDLFRPPTDLTVAGTFLFARTRATSMKNWLLVNVQSDNFNSQLLNRDVWPQFRIRNLIKKYFLLWQVFSDTSEGSRFITFYHCNTTPYLCIIDPRTGEELWKSDKPNKIDVLRELQTFVNDHSTEEFFQCDSKATATSSSSSVIPKSSASDERIESTDNTSDSRKRSRPNELSATELSEEEQIMLAVRNSLQENGCDKNNAKKSRISDDEEDTFHEISDSDDDVQSIPIQLGPSQNEPTKDEAAQQPKEPEKHTAYLGLSSETTTLKIRLVNAEIDESVTLKWPSDTKLRALQLYIAEKFPSVQDKFKLISPFPRKVVDLSEESGMQTLKEANLHPSSTLHVHLDD